MFKNAYMKLVDIVRPISSEAELHSVPLLRSGFPVSSRRYLNLTQRVAKQIRFRKTGAKCVVVSGDLIV